MISKPPEMPSSLQKRIFEKFDEDDRFEGNDTLLTLSILMDEADYKFSKSLEELSFVERTELSAPETISRKRRKYREQGHSGGHDEKNVESRVLRKVQEDDRYANSDKALTIELLCDEAKSFCEENHEHDDDDKVCSVEDLSRDELMKLTKPESISKRRRVLTNQGFISPDTGVQAERLMKADKFVEKSREGKI